MAAARSRPPHRPPGAQYAQSDRAPTHAHRSRVASSRDDAIGLSDLVSSRLRDVPGFPRAGVVFKDITPLLGDGSAFGEVIRALAARHTDGASRVDVVAGVEARGFIIGAALAHEMALGFVPVRKAGKLPGATMQQTYDLEYGSATIEVQIGAVTAGQRVLLVDDVLATGGTANAAWDLLTRCGADVVELATIVELAFLGGRVAMGERAVHALHVVGGVADA